MIYGKINNNEFIKAPNKIVFNGYVYYNPNENILKKAGYYNLLEAEYPQEPAGDGYRYIKTYEQMEDCILQSWTREAIISQEDVVVENYIPDYETEYKEIVKQLIRQKYTAEDEFGLLRQKFLKPKEFAEYDKYVEQCKIQAKEIVYGAEPV